MSAINLAHAITTAGPIQQWAGATGVRLHNCPRANNTDTTHINA